MLLSESPPPQFRRRLLLTTALMLVTLPVYAQRADVSPAPAAPLMSGPTLPSLTAVMPIGISDVTIGAIRVDGAQRLEEETILSYLQIAKGDSVDADRLNSALKSLYATGLFQDVRMRIDPDNTLVVQVKENPVINKVVFEGNSQVSKDDLEKEVQLKSRLVYTLPRVQADVKRLLDVYRRSGRFAATVTPKLVRLEQNRVDLIFEIVEGDRTGVESIAFAGNSAFSASELRTVVSTRESAWWRVFSSSDFYDPDRLNFDRELLRKFYMNEGYVDFRVLSANAELTPDRKNFFITFTVEEGARYKIGKVTLKSDLKGFNAEDVRDQLTVTEGDWYSAGDVERSINKLTTAMGDRQYAFVDIVPDLDRKRDSKTIDLSFTIKEGPRVFVSRIDMVGNTRTLDKVIRRELLLAEGDPFSTTKLRRSEQRVKDLGYFETATITPEEGAQPDQTNLKVEVKEKSTGELSLGAGYSTTDGLLGDFSIRERNFMGKGQDVRVGATLSMRSTQFDFSFTEPYFLDRDLAAGFDLFHTTRDNQDESGYDETNTGAGLRIGYPLSEQLRQRWTYTLQHNGIAKVPADASRYIKEQQGNSLTSVIGQELIYDTRNSRLEPTDGFIARYTVDFAGLGGSVNYLRNRVKAVSYHALDDEDKWIVSVEGEGGYIFGLNDKDVRISDRFFMGGESLRGFSYAGIGPRDTTRGVDDALGGERFVRGSAELTMPSFLPEEVGVKFHAFTDAGVLGKINVSPLPGEVFKTDETLRLSAGFGATWVSPFGPIRMDFARALIKQSYDKTEIFRFSFGTKF